MSETIILHTKLKDSGEYLEYGPSILVHVHAEDCPIESCVCEPTIKEAEILI